mgnify:CR=1 FL=1|tara:strand:+ start:518 stop:910 length:393 start_codon:yes stop_codon:yes gene_type:complete
MTEPLIELKVDRDSVCAGDDCQSHMALLSVSAETTLTEVLNLAKNACSLAVIAGENATWLIDTQGYGKGCVGVVAQQWAEPKLITEPNITAGQIWNGSKGILFFRYWCQSNPNAAFEAIKSGGELPSRYS